MTEPKVEPTTLPSSLVRVLSSAWLRAGIAAVVIFLLVYFNRIDWRQAFAGLSQRWSWLLGAFLLMFPPFWIVSYRFRLILHSQGLAVPFRLAIRWTMIGSFFDLAMPSSNGGDAVKAGYVIGYFGTGRRTRGIMAVAFDRVIGLLGLFLLASSASIFGWNAIQDLPSKKAVVSMALATSIGVLFFFRVLGSRRLYHHPLAERVIIRHPWVRHLHNLIASFNALREHPRLLLGTLGLSMLNHVFWCVSLLCIAEAVGHRVDPIKAFVVFPLAVFGNIFGIAGGFGLGTATFDLLLWQLLGIGNGATIGLIFQLLSAFSRLSGMPFYLTSQTKRVQVLSVTDTISEPHENKLTA